MKRASSDWRENLALACLRVSLAWYFLVWAVTKLMVPEHYRGIVRYLRIDGFEDPVFWFSVAQLVICVAALVGFQRTLSYGLLALMILVAVVLTSQRLSAPFLLNANGFPSNRNVTVYLVVAGAAVALWLLRRRDRWTLDHWIALRRGAGGGDETS